MKIAVINGSPKGQYSVTLQTALYLEKKYPDHEFRVLHVGQKIRMLEKDFSSAEELLSWADAVLFSYPVYTFLAPSQLHRFIELLKVNKTDLKGKYATQISTSKHFYDVTAHKYIEENSLDLGLRYIRGLSADMEDLLSEKGRREAEKFFDRFLWSVHENIFLSPQNSRRDFIPVPPTPVQQKQEQKQGGKDIVILTDETDPNSNLSAMIERFRHVFKYKTRLVNISEISLAGGCLGCLKCTVSEKCVYKDGFDTFLRENIQQADAIVYAFKISDHSMGSRFKMYDDRNFCNGHRAVTVGMPVAYLVSGEYSKEHNLQTVIEARSETGGNFLAGVVSDEYADCDIAFDGFESTGDGTSAAENSTDKKIGDLAKLLAFAIETHHTAPQNFWGVGGMKIFRDLIYTMRGMMRADHKFYKKQGAYDFPQKDFGKSVMMYAVGAMLSNEKVLSKMGNKMNEGMLMPYRQVLKNVDKK